MWIRYGGSSGMTPIPFLFIMHVTIVGMINLMEMMEHKLRLLGTEVPRLMGRNGDVML